MQSKNSLLSKALIKKDFTRFWPVWAVELLGLLMILTGIVSNLNYTIRDYGYVNLEDFMMPVGGITILFSLITAVMVFGYLSDKKEAYLVHSFPVKRQTMFWSHYVAGFLMVFVPVFLCFVCYAVCIPVRAEDFLFLFVVFLQIFAGSFAAYNLACVSMLLTANKLSGMVIYLVFNGFVYGIINAINFMGEFMVYGTSNDLLSYELYSLPMHILTMFTPLAFFNVQIVTVEMVKKHTFAFQWAWQAFPSFFILIPAVLFLVAAYYLYKKRAIETAGDMLAFSWAKPVYKAVFTFFSSLLFVLFILTVGNYGYSYQSAYAVRFQIVFLMILGATLGYFAVTMILNKTFFIWKRLRWFQYVLPAAGMLLVLLGVKAAGAFYVYVPDAEQIDFIEIVQGYEDENMYSGGGHLFFQKSEEIKTLEELTRECIKEQKERSSGKYADDIYQVYYHLKDGSRMDRSYEIDTKTDSVKKIRKYCYNAGIVTHSFMDGTVANTQVDVSDGKSEFTKTWSHTSSYDDAKVTMNDVPDECGSILYEALKQDEKEGHIPLSYAEKPDRKGTLYNVHFEISLVEKSREKYGEMEEETEPRFLDFYVAEEHVHTIKAIETLIKEKKLVNQAGLS